MSAEHLSPETISDFVMGTLDDAERTDFEAHVIACDACSEALAAEARVELSMHAIAEAALRPDQCISCRRLTVEDRCGHCGAARVAGGYRTRAVLAQGPKGRVYLATAPDGARVALKELIFTQVTLEISFIFVFEIRTLIASYKDSISNKLLNWK